jgi:hypothetical protein
LRAPYLPYESVFEVTNMNDDVSEPFARQDDTVAV